MTKTLLTWSRKNDMALYARNGGPKLMALLSKAADMQAKRHSLDEELDLVRATLMRLVEAWSVALEAPEAKEETKLLAESMIRSAAETVSRIATSAAKIRVLDQGAIQLSSVSWVVGEVTKIIEQQIRETDPEKAEAIVNAIGNIKLPVDGTLEKFTNRAADEAFM